MQDQSWECKIDETEIGKRWRHGDRMSEPSSSRCHWIIDVNESPICRSHLCPAVIEYLMTLLYVPQQTFNDPNQRWLDSIYYPLRLDLVILITWLWPSSINDTHCFTLRWPWPAYKRRAGGWVTLQCPPNPFSEPLQLATSFLRWPPHYYRTSQAFKSSASILEQMYAVLVTLSVSTLALLNSPSN